MNNRTPLLYVSNNKQKENTENKSYFVIGNITIYLPKKFNWFQKKMIKWCFGIDIKDYKK